MSNLKFNELILHLTVKETNLKVFIYTSIYLYKIMDIIVIIISFELNILRNKFMLFKRNDKKGADLN